MSEDAIIIPLRKFVSGECQDCGKTFTTPEEAERHRKESFVQRPVGVLDGHCVTTHWEL